MNIVVDKIIAVLQILAFRNTIGSDQNVNFIRAVGHQDIAPL